MGLPQTVQGLPTQTLRSRNSSSSCLNGWSISHTLVEIRPGISWTSRVSRWFSVFSPAISELLLAARASATCLDSSSC